MSLFLGKVHFWLFNKILWFENLEEEIIKAFETRGVDISKAKIVIENKYGKKLENKNLEEIIEVNNIHGWLQNRIFTSEGRMAAWIKFFLDIDKDARIILEKIFKEQGEIAGKEAKEKIEHETAFAIYNSMNNYVLDGMPCDRVNIITISEDNIVQWERAMCVHEKLWDNENLSVDIFYSLRNLWIESFVNKVNNEFKFIEISKGKYEIKVG